jgi:excisionase family DNA binding protein
MSAHDGRHHPLPAIVRPSPGVVEGGDRVAAVRRQAGELEHACGSLAEQVARLAATVTEMVERPAAVPLSVSVEEAARLFGLGRSNLFKLIESGELRSVKVGSRRLVPRLALEEFLAGPDVSAAS